jgi:hypothetical protein
MSERRVRVLELTSLRSLQQLSANLVRDLNSNPALPMEWESSFDFAMCVVSIDYLVKPLNIFAHVRRCLR